MRIISGERRGHRLEGPKRRTRPTSDLVRESIFNILADLVADRPVVDLFAGTGALGLEALSRGAPRATFVERDRGNIEVIRRNIEHLRYEDRTAIVCADAYRWLKNSEPPDGPPLTVFVDPPYRDYSMHPRMLTEALARVSHRLAADSILIVEGPEHGAAECLPAGVSWDLRRYGATVIAVGQIPRREGADGKPAV
jgi:16S rRNA (guanine966-N2)-methyltransferase